MHYETVLLEKSMVAGLRARTNNFAPNLSQVIGGLWQRFYAECGTIPHEREEKAIGLYTNYADDWQGDYDLFVCKRVSSCESLPEGMDMAVIPAGRYAKFVVKGDVQKDVSAFWEELWKLDLPRAYTADFEEYQPGGDMRNSEIHIYISLKE